MQTALSSRVFWAVQTTLQAAYLHLSSSEESEHVKAVPWQHYLYYVCVFGGGGPLTVGEGGSDEGRKEDLWSIWLKDQPEQER